VGPPSPDTAPLTLAREDLFDIDWRERAVVLGSVAGAALLALGLGLIFAPAPTLELFGLVPVSMFAVGKFLPLWGVTGKSHFGPYELGLVIWVLDTASALFWVYALAGLVRFQRLRLTVDRLRDGASLVLEAYPSMRRAALVGLILFVLIPFAGTGAMVGTFVGILLGLRRGLLIAAVSSGGLLGGALMALAADHFAGRLIRLQNVQRDPLVKYGSIAAVLLILVVIVWALHRAYRRALGQARARRQSSPQPVA
jgi:uncharacterized membrane protein